MNKENMEIDKILEKINFNKYPINVAGMTNSAKAYLISSVFSCLKKQSMFIIAYNDLQARSLYKDFNEILGEDVLYFPAREVILYDVFAQSKDITLDRLNVISKIILSKKPKLIITTFEATMQKIAPLKIFRENILKLKVNDVITEENLIRHLLNNGYVRSDLVDGGGQFSVRGSIIDFCTLNSDVAYRIDFFGDEIDDIKIFDLSNQRTISSVKDVSIFPCTEWIFEINNVDEIKKKIESDLEIQKVNKKLIDEVDYIFSTKSFKNLDKFFDYFYSDFSTVFDFFDDAIVFLDEPIRCREVAGFLYNDFLNSYQSLLEKKQILKNAYSVLYEPEEIFNNLSNKKIINISVLENSSTDLVIKTREVTDIYDIPSLIEETKNYIRDGYKVRIYAGNKNVISNLKKEFNNVDVYDVEIEKGILSDSFEIPEEKLVVISNKNIFGISDKKKKVSKRKVKIDFSDLNFGDYVVHKYHGIGQYVGINTLNIEGIVRDYLKISYRDGDMLYVPTSQLDLVDKYIGSEGKVPRLSKMGGSEWNTTKSKVKSNLKDIASELIEIYSKRQASKGYAFSKDTVWQKDFENRFPYNETEDQLRCIDEVKKDMEDSKVMDRLLCGDVGFGKTEVALRAAFKAIMDGKQVAYLVPTTVLANQHYNTFLDRMRGFPIKVEMLSRFRTVANKNKIIKDLKNGVIDVVIGTHSLIQKNIEFKDLGLLIIDEEQKFGVSHKEKLKQLYPDVDVLTLTATPIPRTLHMSMINIRDMSVIYEPPENRNPIQTKVMEYDKEVVREAINREIARGGQVYYVHNKVRSLDIILAELQALVPSARILTGHGQMDSKNIEDVMLKFVKGEADILLCTTIIESGVDIPNANTMIVDDADKLGLAQLYQLKGRIGRSDRVANAYLMYKKDKVLAEDAEKRLKAISDFTEFGSGFKIAMRDLQIRGAGTILGSAQHGHIESVGYDTYCRLLDETVRELQGEIVEEKLDVQIDIMISAYINEDYIKSELQRIEFYKKISACKTKEEIDDVKEEIIDRYGDIPKEINNLFGITELKILAEKNGVYSIKETANNGVLMYFDIKKIDMQKVLNLGKKYRGQILFSNGKTPFVTYKDYNKKEKLLNDIKSLLEDMLCEEGENE